MFDIFAWKLTEAMNPWSKYLVINFPLVDFDEIWINLNCDENEEHGR